MRRYLQNSVCGIALLVLLFSVASTNAQSINEISYPTPADVFFLCYRFANLDPSYSELAQMDRRFKASNEFNRDAVLHDVEAELKKEADRVKDVKYIRLNVADSFGDYDAKYKEFDFGIQDGTSIEFEAFNRMAHIEITNGSLAQTWKLEPGEAEQVLKTNGGDRRVILVLHLAIDPPPVQDRSKLILHARILDYEIRGRGNVLLGKVILK